MPELPEVETIKLGLSKKIVGLKIEGLEILEPKSIFGETEILKGKTVKEVWRRAKVLGLDLNGDLTILFHLKMSGQIIFQGKQKFIGGHPTPDMTGEMPNKSTRVIFNFSDGSRLFFNDQRKFGWVKILKSEEVQNQQLIKSLGPEPLEPNFDWKILKQNLLRHKSQAVKVAILDQSVVAGIGNIYASECLFNARLDPRTKVVDLSDNQFKKLYQGIIKALQDGIKHGGSSKTHFVNEEGKKGYFLDYAFVYWKDGSQCKICGSEIKKIKLGGRGTYYCPKCQS